MIVDVLVYQQLTVTIIMNIINVETIVIVERKMIIFVTFVKMVKQIYFIQNILEKTLIKL